MAGMTTAGIAGTSNNHARAVAIAVTGVCWLDVLKTGTYAVKVPYSRISQPMQAIYRLDGKIAGISVASE